MSRTIEHTRRGGQAGSGLSPRAAVGWHLPSSGSSCVCRSMWWPGPWWPGPWWPSQPILLSCHAQPQLAAQLPCQPLLLLPFHIRLNYQGGSARREKSNLRTPCHSSGQGCASRLPHGCWREPLTHGRSSPWSTWGARPPAPCQVLMGAGTQLLCSCPKLL